MEQNERKYTNGEITVFWKPSSCIHSSVCYTRLLEVFNPRKRPWVNLSGSTSRKIIEVVNQCPTDALTWKYNDEKLNNTVTERDTNHIRYHGPDDDSEKKTEKRSETPVPPAVIRLIQNGPILVEGDYKIVSPHGVSLRKKTATSFCRCGHSGNMPFCDGSHRISGFRG